MDAIADSTSRDAFPLRRTFIQQKQQGDSLPAPLASFVSARDRTALLLYFLALTKASKEPWDVSHHSAVWARALGLPDPTGLVARGRISKAWTRLVDRKLLVRTRRNRLAELTLLCEDGSGEPYTRPGSGFINISHALWTEGPTQAEEESAKPPKRWFELLTLPELVFLIIGLSNHNGFSLPLERGPSYYGISADTLYRGSTGLRRHQLLVIQKHRITAPLAPEGFTYENIYTLRPPFEPRERKGSSGGAAK
ncbi:MAG: hypothetical protein OXH63_00570 [Gemmatimonadetes bacterium]|nr:hypothetical protein [Gemmatimonadota bacterium]